MKAFYAITTLLVALTTPLGVTAQWGQHGGNNGGGGWGYANPPGGGTTTIVAPPVTTTIPAIQTTVTEQQNPTEGPVETQTADTQPVPTQPITTEGGSQPTASAPAPSASGGGGGGVTCGSPVDGNMNVQISGDNVDFRFEPAVDGNPESGMTGDCSLFTFPPGWSGRVHFGGGSGAPAGGTLFEGNVASGGGGGAMDVSYVEGYSVSLMCTDNTNKYMSGCSIDLWSTGTPCPTGGSEGGVCKNPQGPGGSRDSAVNTCEECSPPDPFFGPCAGSAYTFPFDDGAVDGQSGLDISCIIGSGGGTTGREGSTATTGNPQASRGCPSICPSGSKRSLEDVMFGQSRSPRANSPSLLPRAHKRSSVGILGRRSHRHGITHDLKIGR